MWRGESPGNQYSMVTFNEPENVDFVDYLALRTRLQSHVTL